MSFKAYGGLILNPRIPFSRFVEHIRVQAGNTVDERLKDVILKICERSLTPEGRVGLQEEYSGIEKRKRLFEGDDVWTPLKAGDYIESHFKAQAGSLQRNRWDIGLYISAWEIEKRWILMPYEESASIFSAYRPAFGLTPKRPVLASLLPDKKYTRAYGYWDNSDRDSTVSAREWADRKRRWNIISDKWDKLRVTIDILNVDNTHGFKVSWHMQKEWAYFKKRFKIASA